MGLLVANEELTKPREPRVRGFDHPAPRALAPGARPALLSPRAHMRGVVPIEHVLVRGRTDEARVGAQVLARARSHRRLKTSPVSRPRKNR